MERAVIITGASSGIGEAAAKHLAASGYVVYAGVRSEQDARAIGDAHAAIRPLILDVTDRASIDAAVATFASSGAALDGLVNNAGIAVAGPLEFLPESELRRQFDVNVFGAVAVTQAFLPALRAARGRIVFIGSIQGRVTVPFLGPYSASKFALEAVADALRMELAPAGVFVSILEPSAVKTPIWKKGREHKDQLAGVLPAEAHLYYGSDIEAVSRSAERAEEHGMSVERIADVVHRALTAKRPRARYLVGTPARAQAVLRHLPDGWRDRLVRKAMRL